MRKNIHIMLVSYGSTFNELARLLPNAFTNWVIVSWTAPCCGRKCQVILYVQGIEMFGFGNWGDIADHVGTKSKTSCQEHYTTIYLNSPIWPLPVSC